MSLPNQMESGIRAFDIRCRHIDNVFAIHHGSTFQNATFGDVLRDMKAFLTAHPRETLLVRIGPAGVPGESRTTRSYAATFNAYLTEQAAGFIWTPPTGASGPHNPTLGEVRGKIVMIPEFRNYFEDPTFRGIRYADLKGKPDLKIRSNWDLYEWWEVIKTHLANTSFRLETIQPNGIGRPVTYETRPDDGNGIFYNSIVGSGGSLPYFIASGHSSPGTAAPRLATGYTTPGFSDRYPDFPRVDCAFGICTIAFEGINTLTMDRINSGNVLRTGLLMTDFPGPGLIDAVIRLDKALTDPRVSNANDSGAGSLREAIANANARIEGGTTITFDASLNGQVINLASPLVISAAMKIDAADLPSGITLTRNNAGRVLDIRSFIGETVLRRLTITGGNTANPEIGGGILAAGRVHLIDCRITGNRNSGIYNAGIGTFLILDNCEISENIGASGGGIHQYLLGNTRLNNCTISGNTTTTGGGGGIFIQGGEVRLVHSTVAGNSGGVESVASNEPGSNQIRAVNSIVAANAGADVASTHPNRFVSEGHNLVGQGNANGLAGFSAASNDLVGITNPGLAALDFNGGNTRTMALVAGSPAVNGGLAQEAISRDQRGEPRQAGTGVDMGAFELQQARLPFQAEYIQNFNGIPDRFGGSQINFPDGAVFRSDTLGAGGVKDGAMQLTTDGVGDTHGNFIIPPMPGVRIVGGFEASFFFKASASGLPADGFSFNYAIISPGANGAEDGFGEGLTVGFDTYFNGPPEVLGPSVSVNHVKVPGGVHEDLNMVDSEWHLCVWNGVGRDPRLD